MEAASGNDICNWLKKYSSDDGTACLWMQVVGQRKRWIIVHYCNLMPALTRTFMVRHVQPTVICECIVSWDLLQLLFYNKTPHCVPLCMHVLRVCVCVWNPLSILLPLTSQPQVETSHFAFSLVSLRACEIDFLPHMWTKPTCCLDSVHEHRRGHLSLHHPSLSGVSTCVTLTRCFYSPQWTDVLRSRCSSNGSSSCKH